MKYCTGDRNAKGLMGRVHLTHPSQQPLRASPAGLNTSCIIFKILKRLGTRQIFYGINNLVPRACDPRPEGIEGSGIIRFREESDWPLKWNA